jgi:ABC-type uncharacterized transport system auxiliary subunit
MKMPLAALVLGCVALLASGCLLSGKTEAPRYYRPALGLPRRAADAKLKDVAIRVRKVHAAPHLGDRIVWRASAVELGFYESRRWIDGPADVVERAVEEELFGALGMRPASSGACTLELELSEFDEVIAPAHEAEVVLGLELVDASGHRLARETLVARKPVAGDDDPADLARAMGAAVDDVVRQLSERLVAALGK